MSREPYFLRRGLWPVTRTLAYDFYSFATFLLFVALCYLVAAPAYLIDRLFGTRLFSRVLHVFEFFAQ